MKSAEEILKEKYLHPLSKTEKQWIYEAMHEYASQDRWVKVDKDNLPECEVLAINEYEDILVGWLHLEDGLCVCEDEHQQLPDVTHYQIPTPPKD